MKQGTLARKKEEQLAGLPIKLVDASGFEIIAIMRPNVNLIPDSPYS